MSKTIIGIIILGIFLLGGLLSWVFAIRTAKQTTQVKYHIVFRYMGWGGLTGAILTFIITFHRIYTINHFNLPIALAMGLVFGLTGGNFIGIVFGMLLGHLIVNTNKKGGKLQRKS